jgi:hypothetical protein
MVNKELFTFNSQVHNWNTRIIHDFHYPRTTMAQADRFLNWSLTVPSARV